MATTTQALPHRTLVNTAAIFGGEALSRIATFMMAMMVARRFGPEALGQYGYAVALASVLVLVPDFGLHLEATRRLASDARALRRTFWSLHWLKLPLVLAVAVFTVLFGEFAVADPGRRLLLYVLVGRAMLQTFSLAVAAVFKAYEQMHYVALVQFINALVVVVGAALALELGLSVAAVVSAFLAGQVAEILLAWWILLRRFPLGRPVPWDGQVFTGMMLAAAPIGLTSVLQTVNLRLDLMILSLFVPNHELGRFQAAAWFPIGVFLVGLLGMTVLFPRLSRRLQGHSAEGSALVNALLKNALSLAFPGALFAGLAAPWLLRLVFGPELANAEDLLRILAPALPFVLLNVVLFYVFVAAGCRRAYMTTLIVGLAVGVGAGLLLAPRYGAIGSALAAVAREGATLACFLCFLWREGIGRDLARTTAKILLMAGIASAALSGLAGHLLPWVAVPLAWSFAAFAGLLVLVGLPRRDEWLIFVSEN